MSTVTFRRDMRPAAVEAIDDALAALAVRIRHAREQHEPFLAQLLHLEADGLLDQRLAADVDAARARAQGARGL